MNRFHDWMKSHDAAYAASVAAGQTTAWCVPYQDKDEAGNVLSPYWWVNVKPRCMGALTDAERASIQ